MKKLFAIQPLLTTAFVTAALNLAIAFGAPIDESIKAALITVITTLATALVHQTVAAPATVVQVAKDTVESLSTQTVGAAGTVTAKGAEAIDSVVSRVGGLVSSLAPRAKEVP